MSETSRYVLRCGVWCFSIDVHSLKNFSFPVWWDSYLTNAVEGQESCIVLNRRKEDLSFPCGQQDGWHASKDQDSVLATHISDGKEVFSISYRTTDSLHFSVSAPPKSMRMHYHTGIQFAMLLGLADEAFGFHGVTVVVGGKAILLSAPSGTGKTTLGKLLEQFCGAEIINGDFALLMLRGEELIYQPTPFCGSSRICQNRTLEIDRIVFLAQAKENQYRPLGIHEALRHMMTNAFIPEWDTERATAIQGHIFQAVEQIPMGIFAFAPNQEAAEMLHQIVTQ